MRFLRVSPRCPAACVPPAPNDNAVVAPVLDASGNPTAQFMYACQDYYYPDPTQAHATVVTCLGDGTFVLYDTGDVVTDPSTQLLVCLDPCDQADRVEELAPVCDASDLGPCAANANPCDNGNAQGRDWSSVCMANRVPADSSSYTCMCSGTDTGSTSGSSQGTSGSLQMVSQAVLGSYATCVRTCGSMWWGSGVGGGRSGRQGRAGVSAAEVPALMLLECHCSAA
jgi:hypothetical protein